MDVLLVEDGPMIREMLAEAITEAGLHVAAAPSAEVALEVAGGAWDASQPPRVLVTDVGLGAGMDGLALVAEIRRRWPDLGRRGHAGATGQSERARLRPARGPLSQTFRTAPADRGGAEPDGPVPPRRRCPSVLVA